MRTPPFLACLATLALAAMGAVAIAAMPEPMPRGNEDAASAREAIARARTQAREAAERGDRLEREAAESDEAAEKSAREAAALAARVQQAEAEQVLAEAQLRTVARERARLESDLAARQRPLVGLTAALQRLSRSPPAFSLLRPGTVEDTVRARALMASTLPVIERRTSALRKEIAAIQGIEARERAAAERLRATKTRLATRRRELLALETEQRLASRRLGNDAAREEERALALAEEARDLDELVEGFDRSAALRSRLATLPGPKIRPAQPDAAVASPVVPSPTSSERPNEAAPQPYILPANGRLARGFGGASRGVTLAVEPGAAVTAPGAGRIAFAGPYSGYGRIVIIEHEGGWTSLVTGLGRLDVDVGDDVVAGGSLGVADPRLGQVMLELRRDGETVNPLAQVR